MNERKKHWSEMGRVKNSDWFRRLPELERQAVLAALETDTHESAVNLRAFLTFTYSTVICASASTIWAAVFGVQVLWFGVAGGVVGGVVGFLAARIIVVQKTPQDADAMQRIMGAFVGLPEMALLVLGLVALTVRAMA
jgi:hypothetical protein